MRTIVALLGAVGVGLAVAGHVAVAADQAPAAPGLTTPWTAGVDPGQPWPEYPRPQMVRAAWQSLNGPWALVVTGQTVTTPPTAWGDGHIVVPFAPEAPLGGVARAITGQESLWYRRAFTVQGWQPGRRALLHFGAVDWEARVWVNGREVGLHQGGYTPFSFDVTEALGTNAAAVVVVRAWDPGDAGSQPRGRQASRAAGRGHTPVSGIWQSVWLEVVPEVHIRALDVLPDARRGVVSVCATASAGHPPVTIRITHEGRAVATAVGVAGQPVVIAMSDCLPWSPEAPVLYDVEVALDDAAKDTVRGYFAMRRIEVAPDAHGVPRFQLNGREIFPFGPLAQGVWPDGLYTAPCDAALRADVAYLKRAGFNLCRKSGKVEPARWYYWCDKLGLLVWQDVPGGPCDGNAGQAAYRADLDELLRHLRPFACIVAWVAFDEEEGQRGFGLELSASIADWLRQMDPARLVNPASGWINPGPDCGDFVDLHGRPRPALPPLSARRAAVTGAFGGLACLVEGHTWQPVARADDRPRGRVPSRRALGLPVAGDEPPARRAEFQPLGTNALLAAYTNLLGEVRLLRGLGLAAAVYAQLADVEGDCTGLVTSDRRVEKLPAAALAAANRALLEPPPRIDVLVRSATLGGALWRYTVEPPAVSNWYENAFDDTGWTNGRSQFGALVALPEPRPGVAADAELPAAYWEARLRDRVNAGVTPATPWTGESLRARHAFVYAGATGTTYVCVNASHPVRLWLNGRSAGTLPPADGLQLLPLDVTALLQPGTNVVAVECRRPPAEAPVTQRLDVGLVLVRKETAAGNVQRPTLSEQPTAPDVDRR